MKQNMKNLKNSLFKRAYSPGTYLDLQGASRAIDPCKSCRFSWLERRVMVEKRSFRGGAELAGLGMGIGGGSENLSLWGCP